MRDNPFLAVHPDGVAGPKRNIMNKAVLYFLLATVPLLVFAGASRSRAENVLLYLTVEDCRKCHEQEIRDIELHGEKHKTAVTCVDCHLDHPPRGSQAIPECSMCHKPKDNVHFAVDNCRQCHPAHRPRDVDFSRPGRGFPACASCHPHQAQQLEGYPNRHSLLDCKECHRKHGEFLKCLECHEPHVPTMVYDDCLGCHPPHMPQKVAYDTFVPSLFCSGCHPAETADLERNASKHHDLRCVYCHKDQHKRIPQCVTCHRLPHMPEIHEKFPNCDNCHGGPHTLQK